MSEQTTFWAARNEEGPVLFISPVYAYDCAMCHAEVAFPLGSGGGYAVPFDGGPVRSDTPGVGYCSVCRACHDRWSAWDDEQLKSGPSEGTCWMT